MMTTSNGFSMAVSTATHERHWHNSLSELAGYIVCKPDNSSRCSNANTVGSNSPRLS